jgi:hypothetical protein
MSQLEGTDDFYVAGRKLAKHIADSKGKEVSTATLQALIRDFLPQHEEEQEAFRSIVARPDFLRLVKLASSGQGVAQKCALVESLKNIYSSKAVEAADRLVCGMLGLSVKIAHDDSEGQKTTVNTFSHERMASDPQVARQNANPSKQSHAHGKGSEVGENLSSAPPTHSLRNLGLFLFAAFVAGGIWETMKDRLPKGTINSDQKPAMQFLPPSKANWDVCRAAQDIREPTSTYGENTKPLRDGLGRFAPPANTKQQETWWKYSCSEIPGIYDW